MSLQEQFEELDRMMREQSRHIIPAIPQIEERQEIVTFIVPDNTSALLSELPTYA